MKSSWHIVALLSTVSVALEKSNALLIPRQSRGTSPVRLDGNRDVYSSIRFSVHTGLTNHRGLHERQRTRRVMAWFAYRLSDGTFGGGCATPVWSV